jgi:RHS repeat-associated protein
VILIGCVSNGLAQVPGPNARTEPGMPFNSSNLDELENINYFNGRLHFGLPLLTVGGRGKAQQLIKLTIDPQYPSEGKGCPGCSPTFPGGPGYFPLWAAQYNYEAGYGPGVVEAVVEGAWADHSCEGLGSDANDTARTTLRFKSSDGTEFSFVDSIYGGQVKQVGDSCGISDPHATLRGKVFVTKDGSGVTFISDVNIYDNRWGSGPEYRYFPSGLMKMRDGTIFRIDTGTVTWIRDSNGNKISYEYFPAVAPYIGQYANLFPGKVKKITDPLGRQINFTYNNPTGVATERYDEISYTGFGGQARTIRVYYVRLEHALRESATLQTYCQLSVDCDSLFSSYLANPLVVSSVVLPNNRAYHFYYDKYAELTRFELPTGGAVEFDYDWGMHLPIFTSDTYRRVIERRTYPNGGSGTAFEGKTTFSRPEHSYQQSCCGSYYYAGATVGYVDVDRIGKPSGFETLLSRERHYYYGMAGAPTVSSNIPGAVWWSAPPVFNGWPYAYTSWKDGCEYKVEYLASDGFTVLRRVETNWQQASTPSWWVLSSDLAPNNDPRVVETITTLTDVSPNLVAKRTAINPSNPTVVGFDQYNNSTDVWEYDYGQGGPGALLRRSHTDYVTAAAYTDAQTGSYLRSLPSQKLIYNGSGTLVSQTSISYDELSFPLLTYPGVTGWSDPGTSARGNATSVSQWLNTTGGWLPTHAQFDQCGSVRKIWDARDVSLNNPTQIEYSATYQYAFPTLNTSPDPDLTSSSNGPLTPLTTVTAYDLATGRTTSTTDPNNVTSTFEYNDSLERLTRVVNASGGSIQSQTTKVYDDVNNLVTTTSDQTSFNDNALKTQTLYDGFHRTIETRQFEGGSNYIAVDLQYDALGRAFKGSNPYRPWQSESALWNRTDFDALNRPTVVTTADSAVVNTSYSGNAVTVTDQSSKSRRSVSDPLGRLVKLYEDPAGLNYETTYTYNALDDLTQVSQGSQNRVFSYDSLKRLVSASNPENGTISYQYDNNGNMIVKTDGRAASTHYSYDSLNRLTRRWYNGSSSTTATTNNSPGLPAPVSSTAEVNYTYDTATNGKGRLASTASTGSSFNYGTYDALGRVLTASQVLGGQTYSQTLSYDLAGHTKTMTYPSGRTVTYAYDSAGRTNNFSGYLGDGTNRTYATNILYSDFGSLAVEQFGTTTPIYNKLYYNSRGQLSEIREGTTYSGPADTGWERGAIINHYSNSCWGMCGGSNSTTAMTDNNGNLKRQEHWIQDGSGNVTAILTQQYEYDQLNRLKRVYDSTNWQQQYTYDRYGNRTIDSGNTWNVGTPSWNFGVDAATNRLTAPAGFTMSYDSAGNLVADNYTGQGSRVFDAENRLTSAWANGQWQTYVYDSDSWRVKRIVNGSETWQVYGVRGELLAEYAVNGSPSAPQKEYAYRNGQLLVVAAPAANLQWLVSDQIGTPRMVLDKTGSLANVSRHDYLPFGEELFAPIGGRTAGLGYTGSDPARQKFALKERDGETGLDYFGARYYASTQGRFTSVDPITVTPDRFYDPQQFNLYAYTRNNPLRFIDPTGQTLTISGDLEEVKKQLAQMIGTDDAAKRIKFDEKTNTITVDLSGIDLSKNEGAALLNDVIGSTKVYDVKVGTSVDTKGGEISLVPQLKGGKVQNQSMVNLDNNPDVRYKKGDKDMPKSGVDDQIAVNYSWRDQHSESDTKLKLAPNWTTTFHELAEAFAKVDSNMQYAQAHQKAIDRETKLRDQRPYLKDSNPGSGPGTRIIIKQ